MHLLCKQKKTDWQYLTPPPSPPNSKMSLNDPKGPTLLMAPEMVQTGPK